MPVFFLSPECVTPPTISITGDLVMHLRNSLRTKVGETVVFGDGAGHRYRTEITELTKGTMTGRILEVMGQPTDHSPSVTLAQAVLKGEKMDWVTQKATELGVTCIIPLQTQNTIVQLRPERIEAQLARWQRITLEAAQQSEQWHVATIAAPQTLETLLATQATRTMALILAERQEGGSLQTVELPPDAADSVIVLIGPEGGWTNEEVARAKEAGYRPITLGQQILRADTAAIATISIIQSRLGKLG